MNRERYLLLCVLWIHQILDSFAAKKEMSVHTRHRPRRSKNFCTSYNYFGFGFSSWGFSVQIDLSFIKVVVQGVGLVGVVPRPPR